MYVDCKECGFESKPFLPLGPDPIKMAREAIEAEGGIVDDDWVFKCPNGHTASYLPTTFRLWKNYVPRSLPEK